MMKKHAQLMILTFLLGWFLSSCQILPYVLETVATVTEEDQISPTTTIEATALSGLWTATPRIDITPAQATATILPPTSFPTATPMLISAFVPQQDMPIYLPNFAHPSAGCDWMGVAGQVFDSDGREIHDLTVIFGDMLSAEEQVLAARTGLAPAYGPGGYEIQIAEKTFDSSNSLWVQVIDPAGHPVSEKLLFDTFDDCSRNLILINFIPEIGSHVPAQHSTSDPEQDANTYP